MTYVCVANKKDMDIRMLYTINYIINEKTANDHAKHLYLSIKWKMTEVPVLIIGHIKISNLLVIWIDITIESTREREEGRRPDKTCCKAFVRGRLQQVRLYGYMFLWKTKARQRCSLPCVAEPEYSILSRNHPPRIWRFHVKWVSLQPEKINGIKS